MTDDVREQLFGLLAVAEDQQKAAQAQQKAVQAALDGLARERLALAREREAFANSLLAFQEAATGALRDSARETLTEGLYGVTEAATEAERRLARATARFGWRWAVLAVSVALSAIAAVLLVGWLSVWRERQAVEQLRQERQALAAEIEQLQDRAKPKAKK